MAASRLKAGVALAVRFVAVVPIPEVTGRYSGSPALRRPSRMCSVSIGPHGGPQANGLCIRISIRDAQQRERVRSSVEREVRHALSEAGAVVHKVDVVVVDNIERVGTGAKERLVSRPG